MGLPTAYTGLIKPDVGEIYDLDNYLNNLDGIDAKLVNVSTVNSTYNASSIIATGSKFTRLRIGPVGIVVAEFVLDFDAVISVAASTAAPTVLAAVIPLNYRPKAVPHSIPMMGVAPVTNAGSGAQLQWGFNTSGDVLLRNTAASAFSTVIGTDMNFFAVYEWNGIV